MCIGISAQLMQDSHGRDFAYIAEKAREFLEYVKDHGLEVRLSDEGSFRSEPEEMLRLYGLMDRLGADRVGVADIVGGKTPLGVFSVVSTLHRAVSCGIETYFHNDTGCNIANVAVTLEASATHIDTAILGIGESNGITPLRGLLAVVSCSDYESCLSTI